MTSTAKHHVRERIPYFTVAICERGNILTDVLEGFPDGLVHLVTSAAVHESVEVGEDLAPEVSDATHTLSFAELDKVVQEAFAQHARRPQTRLAHAAWVAPGIKTSTPPGPQSSGHSLSFVGARTEKPVVSAAHRAEGK
jgi:hypothetical protein